MIVSAITTSLSWLLHMWARLVMAVLWLIISPFWFIWCILGYIVTHGWALAIAVTGISCVVLSFRYSRLSSRQHSKQSSFQPPIIISEVFKTLPVHPKTDWHLKAVSEGVRVFCRAFPTLSLSSGVSVIASSTFLDATPKRALQLALNTSDLSCWFGKLVEPVQHIVKSHYSVNKLSTSPNSDVISMVIQRDHTQYNSKLDKLWFQTKKRGSEFLEKYFTSLSFHSIAISDYSTEIIERTWHYQNDRTCYIFFSPQQNKSSFPYHWSLCIFTSVPKQSEFSVFTMIMLPVSSDFRSAVDCLTFQLCALREHILLRELKTYTITPTITTSNHRTAVSHKTRSISPLSPVEPVTPIEPVEPVKQDQPSDVVSEVIFSGPHAELDRQYVSMADQCAEKLLAAANATQEDGWTVVGNVKNISIMKKLPGKGEPPVNCVKGSGKINIPPDFLFRLLMDPSHATELDDMLSKMIVVDTITKTIQLVNFKYKAFWPTSARDFSIINVFGRLDKHTRVHAAMSVIDPRVPEEKGFVRGTVISGGYVIKDCPGQPGMSHVTYLTQVDLKGNVPTFLVNKICESQPQCVNRFRGLAEAEFARLNRNPVKLKQFEDQFPIYYIKETSPSSSLQLANLPTTPPTITSSSPPPPPPSEDHTHSIPHQTLPVDEHSLINEDVEESLPSPLLPPFQTLSINDTPILNDPPSPPPLLSSVNELEETYTADEGSSTGSNTVFTVGQGDEEIEERQKVSNHTSGFEESREDLFGSKKIPPVPISTLLDRIPRYHSTSTSSSNDENSPGVNSAAIIDYPRTEEGIDFRTMGNQNAARLLEEMFHISELDLMNPLTHRDQQNGWKYQGIEKDVIILRKKVSDSPFSSFIGKGLVDLAPQEVYNCVRNPNQRFIFDNMLKELHVVKQIEEGLYILHMHHETNQCFLRQSRDFCILACERSEPNKKLIVGSSIEVPECPPKPNCTRGKIITSGWVIEPYRYGEKLLTQVTYLVQVDMGGVPPPLVNFVAKRQPLAIAYLRDYLETTSLNSTRNGRDTRLSLLEGYEVPNEVALMFKS